MSVDSRARFNSLSRDLAAIPAAELLPPTNADSSNPAQAAFAYAMGLMGDVREAKSLAARVHGLRYKPGQLLVATDVDLSEEEVENLIQAAKDLLNIDAGGVQMVGSDSSIWRSGR
jgi:hypothetical protein